MKKKSRSFKNGNGSSYVEMNIEEQKNDNTYKIRLNTVWAGLIYYGLTVILILRLFGKL